MTLKFHIDPKLLQKLKNDEIIFENFTSSGKWQLKGLPRASSLPGWQFTTRCQNIKTAAERQKGGCTGALDHGKVVFEEIRVEHRSCEWHNSFEAHIEVYRNVIKVWQWLWNSRTLSKLFEKINDEFFFWFFSQNLQKNRKNESGRGSCLQVPRAETWLTVYSSLTETVVKRTRRERRTIINSTMIK